MSNFVKLVITEYDSDGRPAIGADDQWLNIDAVTHVEEHLGNNLFSRGPGEREEHYPCLLITSADGKDRLVSLGATPDPTSGMQRIENFMTLLQTRPIRPHSDLGLKR
ncbi:hypothetical protein IWX78_003095 [Mycetocola sp. CAN_C7]|uniref:hypothetical protein n=1 Tax=Mycetocola sp. CAN_C7 TaxID=2787724 RepID=UPI0018CBD50B